MGFGAAYLAHIWNLDLEALYLPSADFRFKQALVVPAGALYGLLWSLAIGYLPRKDTGREKGTEGMGDFPVFDGSFEKGPCGPYRMPTELRILYI